MSDFKEFNDELQKNLLATTRAVNQLCAEDLGFHKSLDPNVGKALDKQNARFLKLAEHLVRSTALGPDGVGEPLSLNTVEAVDNNWHGIVDTIDSLLERAATSIDQYTGTLKRASPGQVRSRRYVPLLDEANHKAVVTPTPANAIKTLECSPFARHTQTSRAIPARPVQ